MQVPVEVLSDVFDDYRIPVVQERDEIDQAAVDYHFVHNLSIGYRLARRPLPINDPSVGTDCDRYVERVRDFHAKQNDGSAFDQLFPNYRAVDVVD